MVKERPILFSNPMVKALLSGAKTQTRRIACSGRGDLVDVETRDGATVATFTDHCGDDPLPLVVKCRQGAPGDRLWVKETWSTPPDSTGSYWAELAKPTELASNTPIRYAADGVVRGVSKRFVDEDGCIAIGRLRPSIFMPRWASRLTLEVTGVRVERLQDISEADAKAEGVERLYGRDVHPAMGGNVETWRDYTDDETWVTSARSSFCTLWRNINGAESWTDNPWVWVVEFKRVTNG